MKTFTGVLYFEAHLSVEIEAENRQQARAHLDALLPCTEGQIKEFVLNTTADYEDYGSVLGGVVGCVEIEFSIEADEIHEF